MKVPFSALKSIALLNTKIGQRFLAIFLAISLLPLAIIGGVAIRSSESAIRQQTLAILRAASDGAEAEVREFLDTLKEQTLELSDDETLTQVLEAVPRNGREADVPLSSLLQDSRAPAHEPVYHTARRLISASLPSATTEIDEARVSRVLRTPEERIPEVDEVFLLDRTGLVVASSDTAQIGRDLSRCNYFAGARQSFYHGEIFKDTTDGRITWVMSAPVRAKADHRWLGVAALRIKPEALSALTTGGRVLAKGADTQSFRIGDTGETYIVNRDGLMITESRFISSAVLKVRVNTLPVRTAFERGQEIAANYRDYRGVEVSGASVILRDPGWVVLTEIDFAQAFAPVQGLRNGLLAVTAGLAVLVVLLAWSSSRRVIGPIQMLHESDSALAMGDEAAAKVPEEGLAADELGDLVRRRNVRVKAVFAYQKQLQDQATKLRDALTELEHMSYSIMHDMPAPLRALIGFGEAIMDEETARLSTRGQEYLHRIRAAAARMDHLICDVLNYSVIARAELPLHPVNVSDLLHGIIESYPALQAPEAEISVPANLPLVQGNEAALTQCFSNLLENAVKFVQPGQVPCVQVRGESDDGWVRISVEDNGVGIPQAMQSQVFGIFQRGSNAGEENGIGLAIVRKAAERMGGRVGVVSEPGHGTRFWVELHRAD